MKSSSIELIRFEGVVVAVGDNALLVKPDGGRYPLHVGDILRPGDLVFTGEQPLLLDFGDERSAVSVAADCAACIDEQQGSMLAAANEQLDVAALQQAILEGVLAYYPQPDVEPLILDNLIGELRKAGRRRDLLPIYSFNASSLWLAKAQGRGQRVGGSERLGLWQGLRARMLGHEWQRPPALEQRLRPAQSPASAVEVSNGSRPVP